MVKKARTALETLVRVEETKAIDTVKGTAEAKKAEAVKTAEETVKAAIRDLDTAASRGTLHPRNAARRKSRLMKQLAALKK